MLNNLVAVTAGKGGVLKTTLSCHLAGVAADAGWRVLLVDADPQGNAMFDLGYRSDGGKSLAAALTNGAPLQPVPGVRPRLDVVCGGPSLDDASLAVDDHPRNWNRLHDALAAIAPNYDLIVVDSPARELWLRHMILTAARFVIVPAGMDRASRVGLPDAAATINEVRGQTNPKLEVLAVTTGPAPVAGTQIRRRALDRLGELIGDPCLVCATIVRQAPLVAEHCREYGLLSHEYAALSTRRCDNDAYPDRAAVSSAAAGVARDWSDLIGELLTRYVAAVAPLPTSATVDTAAVNADEVT